MGVLRYTNLILEFQGSLHQSLILRNLGLWSGRSLGMASSDRDVAALTQSDYSYSFTFSKIPAIVNAHYAG